MKLAFLLCLVVLLLASTFGVHVWIMIVGWGVPAANWWVIIGGWAIMVFLMSITELAKAAFKD